MKALNKKAMLTVNIVIVSLTTQSLAMSGTSPTNLDLFAALIIFVAVFLFALSALYLFWLGRGGDVDTSISFSGAFWPVGKHPYQALALMSVCWILGGAGSVMRTIIIHRGTPIVGVVYICVGAALASAISVHGCFRPLR